LSLDYGEFEKLKKKLLLKVYILKSMITHFAL
jgi:hypothetical protein